MIWFAVDREGVETAVAYSIVDLTCLDFKDDSSYQNTSEYLGGLLCVHGMHLMRNVCSLTC
jgi:hypothetical protein